MPDHNDPALWVAEYRQHCAAARRMSRHLDIATSLLPTARRLAGMRRTRRALERRALELVGLDRLMKHHHYGELAGLLFVEHWHVVALAAAGGVHRAQRQMSLDQVRVQIRAEILGSRQT